jgi:AAA domain
LVAVTATTLARFRTVKAVLDGPYDVVLIDEVGAATLPEVLLAVAKASRCAVLLGDFMQLGPILPRALEDSDRADIRRWLVTDPFRHCGITTLAEAASHPACLVLDTQHRFGPHVMRLANLLAYDGLLQAGRAVRSHDDNDPEIVLVNTDGLHELAEVRRVSRNAGWWAAGSLLSRALVELHHENGETTGSSRPMPPKPKPLWRHCEMWNLAAARWLRSAPRTASRAGSFLSLSSTRSSRSTTVPSGWARPAGSPAATHGSRAEYASSMWP